MDTVTKTEFKQPTNRVALKTALGLIILCLILLCTGGLYWYHGQAIEHFLTLLDHDQYQAARQYDAKLSHSGFSSDRDANKIEASVEAWTEEYLAGHLDVAKLNARINALDKDGYLPGKLDKYRQIAKAEELANQYAVSEAIELTESALQTYPNDPLLLTRQESYWNRLQQTVVYQGPIQHMFFHPLIAYPQRAFDGDAMTHGFNEYFVTIPEFNRIIDALYRNNFVLISYNDMVQVDPEKGTLDYQAIRLPAGKKPLLLSIDDLNYYPYMIQNGTVSKLVLDKAGHIAAASFDNTGAASLAYNNEIIPILDNFVLHHPDFSYRGAKGIIALTGYQGVLGYRTNDRNSPGYSNEEQQARAVIKQLKATGWSFASHGYGHLDTPKVSLNRLMADTMEWKAEVESLVGPTYTYVFPFGSRIYPGDTRFQYLQQAGFKIFCPVGSGPYVISSPQYLLMDRRHIDGISLCTQANLIRDLFDSEAIIDPVRPGF